LLRSTSAIFLLLRRDGAQSSWYRHIMKILVGFIFGIALGLYLATSFPEQLHDAVASLGNPIAH